MLTRGDIVWIDFGEPRGSEPAKNRHAIVIQDDWLLNTKIRTLLVVPLTSNESRKAYPGNVLLPAAATGLDRDCVAVVSQVGPVSREYAEPYPVGSVPAYLMRNVSDGVRLVLGL